MAPIPDFVARLVAKDLPTPVPVSVFTCGECILFLHVLYCMPSAILSIPRNELKGTYKSKFHHFYFENGNLNIHFQNPETPLDKSDWTISAALEA